MVEPILRIFNINKSFGALKASDGVSIDLLPGEIHALIGPNGAGKSTLIKQIAGGMKPDSGRVEFLGQDVTHLSPVKRARLGLGRTFQISALAMNYTALENVMLGALGNSGRTFRFFRSVMRNKALLEVAHEALKHSGLTEEADKIAAELSHGQRRQLEVAIALAMAPKAFLLDEPMAGLGLEGSKKLTVLLNNLRSRGPILLVEHDMDAVFALADRISVLVYGQIIATGTVNEIRNNAEVRRAYLGDEVSQ